VAASAQPTGLVPWVLQRVTGVLLALWVATHFIFWHFAHSDWSFASVAARALSTGFGGWLWDVILAALCLYHGLNGVRNIVYDYTPPQKAAWLTPALWIVGLVGIVLIGYHLAGFRVT